MSELWRAEDSLKAMVGAQRAADDIRRIKEAASYVCDKFAMYDLERNEHHRAELARDVQRLREACWPELFAERD